MAKRRVKADEDLSHIPASDSYIVVDPKKCCGCQACMMACSLVHRGRANTTLSRIQVTQNPYGRYPDDIGVYQCRQCVFPECLAVCPVPGALYIDTMNGNIRRVNESECIGCQLCIKACPFTPSRVVWNSEKLVAQMCDLCIDTPYWNEKGGPDGKQACVEVCPMEAIRFTSEIPTQIGDSGYQVNLRGKGWPLDKE